MSVVTATVKSEGKVMNADHELLYIDVSKEFNKVPTADIKLIDGDVTKNEFKIIDSEFFAPGKKIEIALKYEGQPDKEETVFKGIVINQGLELDKFGSTLTVEMTDEAIKMTSVRKSMVYKEKKDSEIIKTLVTASALKVEALAATQLAHPNMVQYYATDWDFMLLRAEANAQLVIASDGAISTIKPKVAAPVLTLKLGKDSIYDFDLQVNSRHQLKEVESKSWDIAAQALTSPSKGAEFALSQGNYKPDTIATAVGGAKAILLSPIATKPAETKSWADAQIMKSRLSLLRGWIKVPGTAKVKVGDTIEIQGVSARFSGKNIISGVRHQVSVSGWQTHIQIGMDADWFSAQPSVVDSKAAGLLPGVNGLQIGLVAAFEDDPDGEFKVKVNIPAFNETDGIVWARMTSLDAGAERGIFFRPEVGDEVIVGFLNDDPRQAIILGSMHSSSNKTPVPVTDKNFKKGIITKAKFQLLFDEEKKTIQLSTSEANCITIDEENGLISLVDANGNKTIMDSEGIMIDSAKDVTIKAKGNVKISASGNVEIEGAKVDII